MEDVLNQLNVLREISKAHQADMKKFKRDKDKQRKVSFFYYFKLQNNES